ncbi:hypothetical protein H072_7629 [Dactylellina haptotyla CBS 200.50]|uniref:Condensation domain-containing protein n=1 Tax=Dactylellina haptotyla (strain CBS 200.50) TaxID=1284197 RepID=S8A716_DACHA|nr:hypothetical protein H072_7629 [Dactylellina haptotyla CBS 200.50]
MEKITLVRECSNLENYYFLVTVSGSQSSVIVAASYGNRDGSQKLTRDKLIRALAKIVVEQPALGMVVLRQPSEKKDKDMLWLGRFETLDVSECVNFIDVEGDDPADISRRMLEDLFDDWFDPSEPSRPLWKVTVVNMETVFFAFNHLVCDGRSGYFFHRCLLSALNNDNEASHSQTPTKFIVNQGSWPEFYKETIAKHHRLNLFIFILTYLFQMVVELLCVPKYMAYSDLRRYKQKVSLKELAPAEKRIKNKVVSLRIDSETMNKLLPLCRKNSTTFTAFFDTLLNVSLCADAYPDALFARTGIVVDLRSMCEYPHGEVLSNMASSWTKLRRASRFATIGKHRGERDQNKDTVYTNIPEFWAMAKHRKDDMNKNLEAGAISESLQINLVSRYIDDYPTQVYDELHTTRNFSSLISNLVVLAPREEDKNKEWYFTAADWASSTVRSSAGQALNVCITSAIGADCVINLGYEEGTYDQDVIPRLARIMQSRIRQILGDEDAGVTVRS